MWSCHTTQLRTWKNKRQSMPPVCLGLNTGVFEQVSAEKLLNFLTVQSAVPFLFAWLLLAKCSFFHCTKKCTAQFCVFTCPKTSKLHHCWKAPKGHSTNVHVSFTSYMKQSIDWVVDRETFCQTVITNHFLGHRMDLLLFHLYGFSFFLNKKFFWIYIFVFHSFIQDLCTVFTKRLK